MACRCGIGHFGDFGDISIADMNIVMSRLNSLSPSEDSARTMVGLGIQALDLADSNAEGVALQPGEQRQRDNIRAHLTYYTDNPEQLASGFWDIRNWTAQAFVMYNAVAQAGATLAHARSQFWDDALTALENIPGTVAHAVGAGASGIAGAAGQGILSGLLENPFGLALLLGGGYLLLRGRV